MEQREAAEKLKELQQEHSLLAERNKYLASLLLQQWENYRRQRCRQDLILLITILQEANLVKERLDLLSRNQAEYELRVKKKPACLSPKASSERLHDVAQELRKLNKKCKELESAETAAISRCASVIEFMDLDDLYNMTRSRMETIREEKKKAQQVLKKRSK